MAPLTRSRSVQPGDIPGELMREYYEQRASDGGLIISEATTISITARGWYGAPGMYSDEQVEGWKKIVDAVHANGGRMFSQLWHMGRASHVDMTNGAAPVAPSVVPQYWGPDSTAVASTPRGWFKPSPHRALEIGEIRGIIEDYRRAAERAKVAGFEDGLFFEPTILDGMTPAAHIMNEEVFGPVLALTKFRDDDEVVRIANGTRFGLAAGVWTQNLKRAHTMARRLQAGTVWINVYRAITYNSPFGGYKSSGLGRQNGLHAVDEFLQTKSVWCELSDEVQDPFVLKT